MLLLDEPLSALDAKVRVQLRDEIRRVQLEVGTTTLVRHPRPGGGARGRRPGRRDEPGPARAAGAAGRALRRPGRARSSPSSSGLSNKVAATVSDGRATVLGAAVPLIEGSIASGPGQALVRPESVTITADGHGNATVASVNFLGPISRVYVDVDDAEL